MVKGISRLRNKKADSLMVTYVIIIVIAVALSAFVYNYLKLQIPKNQRECEVEVKIIVKNVSCISNYCGTPGGDLALTIENRGLFDVSGLFVRFEKKSMKVKKLLNANNTFLMNYSTRRPDPLPPGGERSYNFNNLSKYNVKLNLSSANELLEPYEVEIQPAVLQDGFIVPCKNSIVTYPIDSCSQRCT